MAYNTSKKEYAKKQEEKARMDAMAQPIFYTIDAMIAKQKQGDGRNRAVVVMPQ